MLSPNGYLLEYEIEMRGQVSFVPSESCAIYKIDLKSCAAAEIAINRINGAPRLTDAAAVAAAASADDHYHDHDDNLDAGWC